MTEEGLTKLVGLKASLNLGLSPELKDAFPSVIATKRADTPTLIDVDSYWVAGFTSGDGSFHVKTSSSSTNKSGYRVQLRFSIGLNIREKELILGIVKFFNLDNKSKYVYFTENSVSLQITNFTDIINIIIPFFEEYSIQGLKRLDFIDFKTVADLMANKEHLTPSGLDKILKIKDRMNKERLIK